MTNEDFNPYAGMTRWEIIRDWLTGWWEYYAYVYGPRDKHAAWYPEVSWWETMRCRRSGHRCGTVFYNPGGLEPDPHCKDCGEDIG